ncbi:hypothetical protein SAMN05216548_10530 [Faunimonas pinastri]|uniref:Uncharacterized protein n=1 Tax=Faunimonas pinastri TaxID=1855383 RepID=A0A1H9GGY2_9HYPH|nr:hypothetical protein [Faunimonas pinastri]SEQ49118.1 hypothetical protein SAMN05216548_10530 [Faunimonas pinastri]
MTDAQLQRLPVILRQVVEAERPVRTLLHQPTVDLLAIRKPLRDLKEVRGAAAKVYGPRLGSESGPLATV